MQTLKYKIDVITFKRMIQPQRMNNIWIIILHNASDIIRHKEIIHMYKLLFKSVLLDKCFLQHYCRYQTSTRWWPAHVCMDMQQVVGFTSTCCMHKCECCCSLYLALHILIYRLRKPVSFSLFSSSFVWITGCVPLSPFPHVFCLYSTLKFLDCHIPLHLLSLNFSM